MKRVTEKRKKAVIKWVALIVAALMFFSVIVSAVLGAIL